jgi:molecular chaperone Hsp33
MSDSDSLQRFMFDDLGIRGELVQLDASWQAVLACHPYPDSVRSQLGQALAAAALLSATIKFQGSLILQAQGNGPLTTLVAQATHQRTVRGLARWQGEVPAGDLHSVFGDSRLVLTIQNQGADPYQGIVAMEGAKLADALRVYFEQSEQLRTRLWLCADGARAVGLLLQELPATGRDADAWERLTLLADTASERELLELPAQTLLYRLFNEEKVRLFAAESVAFRCGCSRERIESVLRNLGREEMQTLLAEQGQIQVDCEFCNQHYAFDAVDVERLLREDAPAVVSATRH